MSTGKTCEPCHLRCSLPLSRSLSLSLFLLAHLFLFSMCSAVLSLGFSLSGNEELWVQSVLEMPKRRDILAIVLIVLPWTLLITVWHQSTIAPLLAVHKGERNQTSPCRVCASLPRPHLLSHFISPWQPCSSQLPAHAHAEASPRAVGTAQGVPGFFGDIKLQAMGMALHLGSSS